MLALRTEIKILHGQTIQNARDSACLLNNFHASHTWLHEILLVLEVVGQRLSNHIAHIYLAFKNKWH